MLTALNLVEAIALIVWLVVFYLAYGDKRIAEPVLMYTQIKGEHMADSLSATYTISAAPVVDADVVTRVLTVAIGSDAPSERNFPGSTVDFGTLSVPQDTSVVLTLVDIDDAGNKSVPAVVEFVSADTQPPAQPGGLGVTLVGDTSAPSDVV